MKKLMKVALLVMAMCLLLSGCQNLPSINVPFDLPFDIPFLHQHEWQDATCEAPKTCACGATEGEALGHKPGAAATCTADQTCTVCKAVLKKATGHTEETLEAKAPTCTATGLTEGKKCSVCGTVTVKQDVIPANGHTKETLAGKAPTCTATGLTEGEKCSVCGTVTVKQDVIPANGHKDENKDFICDVDTCKADLCTDHTEEILAAVAPTCTGTGLTEGKKCSVCGDTIVAQEIVAATGHSYNATVTAPTCTEKGYTTYTCGSCGDTYTADETPVISHSTNHEGKCATCGKYTLPAVGTAFKLKLYQAKLDKTLYFTGATSGNFLATGDVSAAADLFLEETTGGYFIYFMDGETKKYVDVYEYKTGSIGVTVSAEAHGVWVFDNDLGVFTVTMCERTVYLGTYQSYNTMSLSDTYRISGDAAADVGISQFVARAVIIPEHECSYSEATCTKLSACTICGLSTGELKAHSYDEGVVTAPTCTAAGYTTYTCTVCEGTKKEDGAAATGHNYVDGVCAICSAQQSVKTWQKADSIAIGDVVTLVYETGKMELSAISTTSTKYGVGVAYTDAPAGVMKLTVVAGSTNGTYAFQTEDGKYLYWTSGNSLNVSATLDAKTSWNVTFNDGNVIIKNAYDSSRQIFWNAQFPRFACYTTTTQSAIQLYVYG